MKKSILNFKAMKAQNEPITWITAYNYPLAVAAERAGVDMILVGDSGGMVELGYKTTNPVTMDEMIQLAKAVRRGAPETFIVGDMPQGSYEISNEEAIRNAMRFVKEAGCDAIKLEGGIRVGSRIEAIINSGIPVIGHLGLTPQSTVAFGGYKVQGKTPESFTEIYEESLYLENLGISMILLEAMPKESAEQIAKATEVPIMGIGAGVGVDGQLIIMSDLLGLYPDFRPYFAKCYVPYIIDIYLQNNSDQIYTFNSIKKAGIERREDGFLKLAYLSIKLYCEEVKNKIFPGKEYTYSISSDDLNKLKQLEIWKS